MEGPSLKQRFHEGLPINQIRLPMSASAEEVKTQIRSSNAHLVYIDAQHGAFSEWDIVRICTAAEEVGVGVQMRIRHTRLGFLSGNYADIGLLGIKVPEVKEVSDVKSAVDAFYFPPKGIRSWGGDVGFNVRSFGGDRIAYAQWWNENGILGLKIESIKAVLNARSLVLPGVDYVDFGPMDLAFDMETNPHPTLNSLERCREFVESELKDISVRIM